MGVYNIVFSEEEKRSYQELIIKGIDKGKTDNEIAKEIGISNKSVKRFREELLNTGKITQERIQEGKQRLLEEKEKIKAKEINEVLRCLKEGLLIKEIVENLTLPEGRVKGYKKELIESGKISEKDIEEAKGRRKEKEKKAEKNTDGKIKNNETFENVRESVLKLFKLGVTSTRICEILSITSEKLKEIKKILIKENIITEEEIKAARKNKIKNDKEKVYILLLEGRIYKEIVDELLHENISYVTRLVDELKKEGRITKEEIEKARFERREKRKKELIHDGLLQGLTWQEIVDSDEENEISLQTVATWRKKLIESGEINKKDLDEIIAQRNEKQKLENEANYVAPTDKDLIKLTKLGFKIADIAKIIGVTYSYAKGRRWLLIKRGDIDRTEMEEAVKNKETNAAKRMNDIKAMASYQQNVDTKTIETQILYLETENKLTSPKMNLRDINTLAKVATMDISLITAKNINFILTSYTKLEKYDLATKFIDQCIESLDKIDKIRNVLVKIKQEIIDSCYGKNMGFR